MSSSGQQTTITEWNVEAADLTETEAAVYEEVLQGDKTYREFAEERGWESSGTVSNLARRVREKLGDKR